MNPPVFLDKPQRLLKEARRSAESRVLVAVGERSVTHGNMTSTEMLLKEAKSLDWQAFSHPPDAPLWGGK